MRAWVEPDAHGDSLPWEIGMDFGYDIATLKTTWGVYAIVNKNTGRAYIGSTGDCFLNRWKTHWYKLQSGKGDNYSLQWDWLFLGPDHFLFQIIESYTGKPSSWREPRETGPWARHREALVILRSDNLYNTQMPTAQTVAGERAQNLSSLIWEDFYGSPPPLNPNHDWFKRLRTCRD